MVSLRRELTHGEFQATFASPMRKLQLNAATETKLWSYAAPLLEQEYPDFPEWRVSFGYESSDSVHQHFGIPVPRDNTYLVIVFGENGEIVGHHLLDLHRLYGLDAKS